MPSPESDIVLSEVLAWDAPDSLEIMTRPKARVLPEPVRAQPATSRPSSPAGIAPAWIGVGSTSSARARAASSRGSMPSDANPVVISEASVIAVLISSGFSLVASVSSVGSSVSPAVSSSVPVAGCARRRARRQPRLVVVMVIYRPTAASPQAPD